MSQNFNNFEDFLKSDNQITVNQRNLQVLRIEVFNKINSFSTNVPLQYPLKTLENLWFSNVFRGYRSGTLVDNGLTALAKQ